MPGTQAEEKTLHARFWRNGIRGEWFNADAEVLAYIAELPLEDAQDAPVQDEWRTQFLAQELATMQEKFKEMQYQQTCAEESYNELRDRVAEAADLHQIITGNRWCATDYRHSSPFSCSSGLLNNFNRLIVSLQRVVEEQRSVA